jgi:hypothetical protein
LNSALSRNERADVGAIIGGIFLLFPFLWTMKYNPVHTYELRSLDSASLTKADQSAVMTDAGGSEYISGVMKD